MGRSRPPGVGRRSASARPTRTSPPAGCPPSSPRPTPPTARQRACRSRISTSRPRRTSPATSKSAVVHYGDTTLTFLNNWFRADQRGNPFGYVSAVAVEEKSVIDYNTGDPDGIRQDGEEPRPPRVPLVAIYPEEGTLYSDNPLFVLDADWVDDDRGRGRPAVHRLRRRRPPTSARCWSSASARATRTSQIGEPIDASHGVDPDQPQTLLDVPGPDGHGSTCSTTGRTSASRPGCCSSWTCPAPWATWPIPTTGRHEARPRQAGDDQRPRRLQRRRRGRPRRCSPPTSADGTRTSSTLVEPARMGDIKEQLPHEAPRPGPAQRHAALPRDAVGLRGPAGRRYDAEPDQRRRAADRRRERRRRARRRPRAARRRSCNACRPAVRGAAGPSRAGVPHRLRRGGRPGHAAAHRRGQPSRRLRRRATRAASRRCSSPSSPTSDPPQPVASRHVPALVA